MAGYFKHGLDTVVWINAERGWQNTRKNRVDTDLYDTGVKVLDSYAMADQEVVFFWTRAIAVRTRWSIFKKYWDDFCYPGDDNLVYVDYNTFIIFTEQILDLYSRIE